MRHPTEEWDFIVVGGGSAGCALGFRLSQRTGARILLLEAGPRDRWPAMRVPAAALWTVDNPAYDWRYDMEPDASRDGRVQRCHSGRVLGGGSSINGMIYTRGAPEDFDSWARAGATGWAYSDVLPYFRRAETRRGGDALYRGASGPLHVEDPRSVHGTTERFLAATRELGMPSAIDYNGAAQDGSSLAQLTQRRGARHSTAVAYRPLARSGLEVRTGALATRLHIEGGRCVGVRYRWRGAERSAAAGSVVLSAGAIASPKLLLLSGIGDRAALAEHGIAPALHLPGVGRNFSDHIGAGVGVHVSVPTYNTRGSRLQRLAAGVRWLATRRGPATSPLCQAVAFTEDLQLMFSPVALSLAPGIPGRRRAVAYPRAGAGIYVDLGRPRQRGHVALRSADPDAPPRIAYQLLGDPEDVAALIRGGRLARALFAAPALRSIVLDERFPGASVATDAEWREALKVLVSVFHHPTGTCAIGSDADAGAVVDPQLRVHGLEGLCVADASVMPLPINGNTNAAAIMIAERAAEWLSGATGSTAAPKLSARPT
jgi:choline dehydrogenase